MQCSAPSLRIALRAVTSRYMQHTIVSICRNKQIKHAITLAETYSVPVARSWRGWMRSLQTCHSQFRSSSACALGPSSRPLAACHSAWQRFCGKSRVIRAPHARVSNVYWCIRTGKPAHRLTSLPVQTLHTFRSCQTPPDTAVSAPS